VLWFVPATMIMRDKNKNAEGAAKEDARAKSAMQSAIDAALSELATEFHNFVADVEDLLKASSLLSEEDLAGIKAKLEERVAAARESIGQVGDTISEKSSSTIKRIDDFVRDRPWQAAGIGIAAGLLIGLLLIGVSRSRRRD
jgi:ElaB/YqjD/DUF883 family membrane-anchored ribosome-binding protein